MEGVVITGASRGLGAAVAKRLGQRGCALSLVSRRRDEALVRHLEQGSSPVLWLEADLGNPAAVERAASSCFEWLADFNLSFLGLVNNAGILDPISRGEDLILEDVVRNVAVNLTASMLFMVAFLRCAQGLAVEKRAVQISSGAGRKPYAGWSVYCAAKAGVDHFTRCVALEQEEKPFPVRVVSLAPAVMDTAMQARIRQSSPRDFPALDRFQAFHAEGKLLSPDLVAEAVESLLFGHSFKNGALLDVRDLLGATKRFVPRNNG